ncbi:MAG: AMP-binding protein, partial [Nitrospirota bacterium]|nr:AMP-binding protein [Nitrospirota bacterium]
NVAVRIYDKVWSYGELHSLSNTIARFLLEKGIQKGDRVAVLMNKSIYLYAAIIGIIKSGGVYVPLDSKAPPLRLARMLEDIDPFYVFIDHFYVSQLEKSHQYLKLQLKTIFLDNAKYKDYEKIDFEKATVKIIPNFPSLSSDDLALILFTSGSTGIPKGATITHRNLYDIIHWTITNFDYGPGDVGSAFNATAFDMSLADLFPILGSGGTLGVYPEEIIFAKDILQLTYKYSVSKMFLVPSVLTSLVDSNLMQQELLTNLKDVFLGGELIPVNTLIKIMNLLPHARFHNCYGPTETALYVGKYTFATPPNLQEKMLPIGFPIANNRFTLDHTDFLAGENKGELIIFGPQVGAGYWNDPEKTDKSFGVNEKGERFYRTGDIASFDPVKGYFIHGRKDSQVKFMGYRIDLGEIEHVLSTLPFIRENMVIPVYINREVEGLKLVYTSERECVKDILYKLKKILPSYMIPKYFTRLKQLPKNQCNKVDRAGIKEKHGKAIRETDNNMDIIGTSEP